MAKRIFMGNYPTCYAECYELHRALAKAFDLIGGNQQPVHLTSEAKHLAEHFEREHQLAEFEIEKIATEIFEKLTGKTITVTEESE